MECLGITWWQWWILVAVTVNTTINAIVFYRGRKIKRDGTEIYDLPYGVFRYGGSSDSVWKSSQSVLTHLDTGVSDTNSHTYKFTVKREDGGDELWFDANPTHSITVMEIAA